MHVLALHRVRRRVWGVFETRSHVDVENDFAALKYVLAGRHVVKIDRLERQLLEYVIRLQVDAKPVRELLDLIVCHN